MIRGILVVVFMFFAVSIGLVFNPISPRDAGGQNGPIGPLPAQELAGVYVEDAAEDTLRIVVIYADGNWTLQSGDEPLSFGVSRPATESTQEAPMLEAKLVDSQGGTEDYILTFAPDLESVTVENVTTADSFTALRESVATETDTAVQVQ